VTLPVQLATQPTPTKSRRGSEGAVTDGLFRNRHRSGGVPEKDLLKCLEFLAGTTSKAFLLGVVIE
jgi:hypothetical protein